MTLYENCGFLGIFGKKEADENELIPGCLENKIFTDKLCKKSQLWDENEKVCKDRCSYPEIWSEKNNGCQSVCSLSQEFKDGKCRSKCENHQFFNKDRRTPGCKSLCDSNQTIKDGKCAQIDLCEAGKVWDGTTCLKMCLEDEVLTENNTCEYQHQVANYKGYHTVGNSSKLGLHPDLLPQPKKYLTLSKSENIDKAREKHNCKKMCDADEECVLFEVELNAYNDGEYFTCLIYKEREHRDDDLGEYSTINDFGIHNIQENRNDGTVILYNTYGSEDAYGRKQNIEHDLSPFNTDHHSDYSKRQYYIKQSRKKI
jgi:hypothetical protein